MLSEITPITVIVNRRVSDILIKALLSLPGAAGPLTRCIYRRSGEMLLDPAIRSTRPLVKPRNVKPEFLQYVETKAGAGWRAATFEVTPRWGIVI